MGKVIIAIVAVVLLGGGAYYFMSDDDTNTNSGNSSTNSDAVNDVSSMTESTLNELFARGENLECMYTYSDAFGSQEGTVYVAGGEKIRGDFTLLDSESGETTSHIIQDGEYHYNWGTYDGQEIGTKMKLSEFQAEGDTDEPETADDTPSLNYDHQYEFDCDRWTVDDSKFEVPANVEFTDLTAQMEAIEEVSNSVLSDQCGNCDALGTDAARDSCRQALGC
ncbi:MAG: hypothetical protein Q8Q20_04040 [bacterium]|nr:hypothetical protein [bacterium]